MADTDDGDAVECPICGQPFDPTAAGGWCTNPDCGEWQHDGDALAGGGDADEAGADVAPAAEPEADPTDEPETGAEDESRDADAGSEQSEPAVDETGTEAADPTLEEPEPMADEPASTSAGDAADGVDVDSPDESADEAPPTEDADAPETAGAVSATGDAAPSEPTDDADADADREAGDEPATLECPDCGTELDADANFCIECGADVRAVDAGGDELAECPACGTELDGDEHFCANCGEDLDAHRSESEDADEDLDAHRSESEDADDDVDAVDALAAQSSGEAADIPDSLVLSVAGTEITVGDGDQVGREIRAALTDAGRPEDEAVRIHREHVRFVREADGFYLVDLGENPTTLNGRSLRKGDREPVGPGDELELSGVATVTIEAP